ncbi:MULTISPECIES: N-acyl homoserine lactonase family protein [unclassified Achromobacter]|uniref:N-acyl homoserine lactonase family protein n=1 Tax=unclassified Achromobacter TaxID=2626865 RepID=UPI000B516752|nr:MULTISPECIES: N-acyl homoserine lactonase family protein [unclassified Achromobacter]OWT73719.1 MBL fold hydrolase [Achromobacter sp. HZ34]OWT79365.1 MBL fold hydrolase [Achromobacter sp. HZ28]
MTIKPEYEVIALKYATRDAQRAANFLGGDPHDAPMPMDYYVWVIRNADRIVLVDTGFEAAQAIKRHRTLLRKPADALRLVGIDASRITDVVITHLHNDHAGTLADFPKARFHLQDTEMAFATGRHMCCGMISRAYEPDDVIRMLRLVYGDRVVFHDGDDDLFPGISVHRIGGHTDGLQAVRVSTARGWVVLASDASHYYEHFENDRCFPLVFNVGDVLQGYRRLAALAESPAHVIPGHDPLVLDRYPRAAPDLGGIAARLDLPPLPSVRTA